MRRRVYNLKTTSLFFFCANILSPLISGQVKSSGNLKDKKVILILADDMGGHLSCMGTPASIRTPSMNDGNR